jgi:N-acetylated-alpha-linked acidic dipeptidase
MQRSKYAVELEKKVREEISPEQLWKHLEYLSTLERVSGTPGEEAAAYYIQERLRDYGVAAEVYEFDSFLSYTQDADLQVLSPERKSLHCRSVAFSAPTSKDGIQGELVYVGSGLSEEYEGLDVQGKIVMADGEGSPSKVREAERKGAAATIFVSGEDVIHEFTANPIWGTPTPTSIGTLPKISAVAMTRGDGAYLKNLSKQQTVTVRLASEAWMDWKKVWLPVGTIEAGADHEEYVLVGGHLDSWYFGVTDNATGNACCLELARVLAKHQDSLRRGVRIAWWPGHSQGRYSGSTWYADNFWEDLHRRGIAYINIDSPGVKGAEIYSCRVMAELEELALQVIEDVSGQRLEVRRPGRSSDQSFWGAGVPSLAVSNLLPPGAPHRRAIPFGSGGGTWWHSPEDTIEYADRAVLAQDTALFASFILRLCNSPILPMSFVNVGDEFLEILTDLQRTSGDTLDLDGLVSQAEQFKAQAIELEKVAEKVASKYQGAHEAESVRINNCLVKLSRILNPVLYTISGMFDHPPAVPTPLLPVLQPVSRLASLGPGSDEFKFLRTQLVRDRNRVSHALSVAVEQIAMV